MHLQERRGLFQPHNADPSLPFFTEQTKPWRKSKMILAGGTEDALEDNWTYQAVVPLHGELWTGETWFDMNDGSQPPTQLLKRDPQPEPLPRRLRQKTHHTDAVITPAPARTTWWTTSIC